MIEMTLSSRYRIRNSSPGGLRPSTLPLGQLFSDTDNSHYRDLMQRRVSTPTISIIIYLTSSFIFVENIHVILDTNIFEINQFNQILW